MQLQLCESNIVKAVFGPHKTAGPTLNNLSVALVQESDWLDSGLHFAETLLGVGPHLDSLLTHADLHNGIAD